MTVKRLCDGSIFTYIQMARKSETRSRALRLALIRVVRLYV